MSFHARGDDPVGVHDEWELSGGGCGAVGDRRRQVADRGVQHGHGQDPPGGRLSPRRRWGLGAAGRVDVVHRGRRPTANGPGVGRPTVHRIRAAQVGTRWSVAQWRDSTTSVDGGATDVTDASSSPPPAHPAARSSAAASRATGLTPGRARSGCRRSPSGARRPPWSRVTRVAAPGRSPSHRRPASRRAPPGSRRRGSRCGAGPRPASRSPSRSASPDGWRRSAGCSCRRP